MVKGLAALPEEPSLVAITHVEALTPPVRDIPTSDIPSPPITLC